MFPIVAPAHCSWLYRVMSPHDRADTVQYADKRGKRQAHRQTPHLQRRPLEARDRNRYGHALLFRRP